jgi:hypothetical protein
MRVSLLLIKPNNDAHLNGKQGLGIDCDTKCLFDILGQPLLVVSLGSDPFLVELGIAIVLEQTFQEIEVLEPGTRSKSLGDETTEDGVALVQPSPRGRGLEC